MAEDIDIYSIIEEKGINFLLNDENKHILFSDGGLNYMLMTDKFEIFNHEIGGEWLLSEYGEIWLTYHEDWIPSEQGQKWLSTVNGKKWIHSTEQGKSWIKNNINYLIETDIGNEWLESEDGQKYIDETKISNSIFIKKWLDKKNEIPDHEKKIKLIQDNKRYLLSEECREWIKNNEYGIKWYQSESAKKIYFELMDSLIHEYIKSMNNISVIEILNSEYGHQWLNSNNGQKWINTIDGQKWIKTHGKIWWIYNTNDGQRWLHTYSGTVWYIDNDNNGKEWINSEEGYLWLSCKNNLQWLENDSGRNWLNSIFGYKWVSTEYGLKWLAYENKYKWITTHSGNKWFMENKLKVLMSEYCYEFFMTEYGQNYLEQYGLTFILTKEGIEWLDSDYGYQVVSSFVGSKWIENHSQKIFNHNLGIKWLNSQNGNKWLSSPYCIKGLHYNIIWINQKEGSKWLNTYEGRKWLDGENGNTWLSLPEGINWLNSNNNYLRFLEFDEGKKWLGTCNAKIWLRTNIGIQWFNEPNGGYIWLITSYGRIWLNSVNGHRYLGTNNGYQWLMTEDGNIWLLSDHGTYWRTRTEWGFIWSTSEYGIRFYQEHQELTEIQRNNQFNYNDVKTYNIPFETAKNMLCVIIDIFRNIQLDKYIKNKLNFVGTDAVDSGGVSREAYNNILQTYFTNHTFDFFKISHLIEKYEQNIDFENASINVVSLSNNYYESPQPIKNFGYFLGYICHLCQDGFGFRAGLGLDKYMISLISEQNNSILDNLNNKVKNFYQKSIININYNDISLTNYPIIGNIVYLITSGGEHTDNFENKVKNCIDNIYGSIKNDSHKIIFEKILLENICIICCESSNRLDEINKLITDIDENSKLISFRELIETLAAIYEYQFKIYHLLFLQEFKTYLSINKITQWKTYIINDAYDTSQKLYAALQRIILDGNGKDKLMKVIKRMEYDDIRKLLYFWTSSSYILNKQYSVIFLNDNNKLPISHTCSYQMEIPNNSVEELHKKINIVLDHNSSFGFG
jgi:hypothetical protein